MDEYAYIIIEKMGFSSRVELKKKRVPSSQKKQGTIMAMDKLDHICQVRKGTTPQNFTFMTFLFYKNPRYQLRLKDGFTRTVDVTQNIRHFQHSNASIKVGSNRKLKREMPDSVLADQMGPSHWKTRQGSEQLEGVVNNAIKSHLENCHAFKPTWNCQLTLVHDSLTFCTFRLTL